MRKVILSMMMTLDGFIAGPNDEMDWLPPFNDEELWKDIHEEMWNQLRSVDTFLLGRVAYQIWENYWPAAATNPSSTKNDIEFSQFADETQKIVFSKTLKKVEWKNTRLVKENIAQTFMKLGLIDEYRIIVHPVILGKGKSLFKDIKDRINLKLLETKKFNSGSVGLSYRSDTKEVIKA